MIIEQQLLFVIFITKTCIIYFLSIAKNIQLALNVKAADFILLCKSDLQNQRDPEPSLNLFIKSVEYRN